ncbi:hypothetical protein EYF80_048759 [Liparis tanakae]|uniref:Uncharacterized protein n=1 Tax=Liparis tanakae TaxID=230148 RepID=A0A4Z2FJC6_9TELE|nr:hypothetical protein EYF80_048759 [Liparis tanakae]
MRRRDVRYHRREGTHCEAPGLLDTNEEEEEEEERITDHVYEEFVNATTEEEEVGHAKQEVGALAHLPRQAFGRPGGERRAARPDHKGVSLAGRQEETESGSIPHFMNISLITIGNPVCRLLIFLLFCPATGIHRLDL